MDPLAEAFKSAFRSYPTGVALVSAADRDGPVGLTLSSVASLAVDPVSISFSLAGNRGSAARLLNAASFVVHLLGADQADIALAFARSGSPRFTPEQGWITLPTGEPLLPTAPVALLSRPLHQLPVGGSILIAAEVIQVIPGTPDPGEDMSPLLYRNRQFLRLADTTPA